MICDHNRLRKNVPTPRELSGAGARSAILAHQGDTEDYGSLVPLLPDAERLTELLGRPVEFIDDIAGPAAIDRIKKLRNGELLLLNNVCCLAKEVSTFTNFQAHA